MNIIVCTDELGGVSFNNRRLSRDEKLIEKIYTLLEGNSLYMNAYSARMFDDNTNVIVDENFLEKANKGSFCFIENEKVPDKGCDALYIFNWHRRYPSDYKLDVAKLTEGMYKISEEEFQGKSHERISLEIYRRDKDESKS